MSSTRARCTASMISGCIQSGFDFSELRFVFGQLGADRFYYFRRRLAQEDVVAELTLRVGDVLDELVAFLLEPLALGFKLAVRNVEREIKVRGGTDGAGLRDIALHEGHTAKAAHQFGIDTDGD